MSRQALILRRRQTQQSCSAAASVTSAPQTVHLVTLLALSGEMDRLACSRISGETIGPAGLGGALRLIEDSINISEKQIYHNTVHTCISYTRIRPPRVLQVPPPHPVWPSISGTSGQESPGFSSQSVGCPRLPYGYKSGNGPVP